MNELLKYKQKITRWTILLVITSIVAIALLFASSPDFSNSHYSVILLAILMVQVILTTKVGMLGTKITQTYIKAEEDRNAAVQINDEHYEQEVDKKIMEATDNLFNTNTFVNEINKTDDWKKFGDSLLYNLSKQIDVATGIVFKATNDTFDAIATFAYYNDEQPQSFKIGEGISGQVAKDRKAMFLNELPNKNLTIVSGLGQIEVNNLAIIPILKDNNAIGLIEIATFKPFEKGFINKIDEISKAIGEITPQ